MFCLNKIKQFTKNPEMLKLVLYESGSNADKLRTYLYKHYPKLVEFAYNIDRIDRTHFTNPLEFVLYEYDFECSLEELKHDLNNYYKNLRILIHIKNVKDKKGLGCLSGIVWKKPKISLEDFIITKSGYKLYLK